MRLNEVSIMIDLGNGLHCGVAHCQPHMNPREFQETLGWAAELLRAKLQRIMCKLSEIQEVQITVLRVETIEDAKLPTEISRMPEVLPGHRRGSEAAWEWVPRGEAEKEVANGHGA